MARSEKQKLKTMAVLDILRENTDDEHGITMPEIIEKLDAMGITAERKSVYKDIEHLQEYGYEISGDKEGGKYKYYLLDRNFELPELKLLVDAVQASKFISEKRSTELISKIEKQASKYQAKELHRQVYVANRVKTDYESVYYNIDDINLAINEDSQIEFDYFEWNMDKEMTMRENGHKTKISPWALMWDDENYYMVAFDGESEIIKHYRVDKIRHIKLTGEHRDGKLEFDGFDMASYAKETFGMFTGEPENVELEFDNNFIGVVLDRFGKDIMVINKGDKFRVHVDVNLSDQFFGWIMGLNDGVKIVGPENVVEAYKEALQKEVKKYK